MQPTLADLTHQMANRASIISSAQYAWLQMKHRGNVAQMRDSAERNRFVGTPLQKVLMTAIPAADPTTAGWAQELAPVLGLNSEWAKSITATTLIGQLPYLRAAFDTKSIIDVQPGAAAWVQPGSPIPMARLTVGATGQLTRKKIATLVPVTNESLESWSVATAENLIDVISRTVRLTLDRSLLDPDSSVSDARPASLTNGITASQSTGSSAAQITADLAAAIGPVVSSSSDPSRVRIVMSAASALFLAKLLTAGNTLAFEKMGALGGEIWGVPVIVTNAAVFIGSPSANLIVVIDASRVVVADDSEMMVDASAIASVTSTDNPSGAQNQVSFFQTNSTSLRIILAKNFVRATAAAVTWISVQY